MMCTRSTAVTPCKAELHEVTRMRQILWVSIVWVLPSDEIRSEHWNKKRLHLLMSIVDNISHQGDRHQAHIVKWLSALLSNSNCSRATRQRRHKHLVTGSTTTQWRETHWVAMSNSSKVSFRSTKTMHLQSTDVSTNMRGCPHWPTLSNQSEMYKPLSVDYLWAIVTKPLKTESVSSTPRWTT